MFSAAAYSELAFSSLPIIVVVGPSFKRTQLHQEEVSIWQEYQAYTQRPYSQWYIPNTPTTHQLSQRFDPLPNFWQEWEAYTKTQPVSITYLPFPPVSPIHSQRFDSLPDYWQEWEAYKQVSFSSWFTPDVRLKQNNQRIDYPPSLEHDTYQRLYATLLPIPVVSPYFPHLPIQGLATEPEECYVWYTQRILTLPYTRVVLTISWSGISNIKISAIGYTNILLNWMGVSSQIISWNQNQGFMSWVGEDEKP